jgi:hypothetical protein
MSLAEKRVYLEAIKRRYRLASRAIKSRILDEFCAVCRYNRKYAIRVLGKRQFKKRAKPGRKPWYDPATLLYPLKTIWLAADQMCSKRLKVALREWLPHYENEHGNLDDVVRFQLYGISPATIDRLLKPFRIEYPTKGLCGTKPGRLLKTQIPIRTDNWDVTQPGFMEVDTVAHCGNSLAGDFVWSLTMTDILTGWTENRATWNKGADGVIRQVENIEKKLPFLLLACDCDNGSEFINHRIYSPLPRPEKSH